MSLTAWWSAELLRTGRCVIFRVFEQYGGVTRALRRALKRRNAIEPIIGHAKHDGLMGRNYLLGSRGDAMNAILAGAGHNLRIILRKLRLSWLGILHRLLHDLRADRFASAAA